MDKIVQAIARLLDMAEKWAVRLSERMDWFTVICKPFRQKNIVQRRADNSKKRSDFDEHKEVICEMEMECEQSLSVHKSVRRWWNVAKGKW